VPHPAYLVTRDGDTLSTMVGQVDDHDLGDGSVTVDVAWSAVNYKDAMVTVPGNRVARRSPLVPGVDLAGTVCESDDPALPVGTEVLAGGFDLGVAHHGGFATRARVPAAWLVPLPPGLSLRHAMVLGTAGLTAALALERLGQVGVVPGDGPVLVTGASGGVGSVSIALLAARGYQVVASSGKDQEHPYLRALGAAEVVGRDEIAGDPGRVLGPERWAGAIDCVGAATLAGAVRATRYGGAVVATGLTGGTELTTTVFPFITRHVALLGVDSVLTPIGTRRRAWATLADCLSRDTIESMVAREVGLGELDDVLATILTGGIRGRVLVRPGG
jgi:acrylyl-CoA reductase (NADPH)